MKTWTRIGTLFVGALLVSACAAMGDQGAIDDSDMDQDAIYAASGTLWQTRAIPVCWENPGANAAQRGWVQDQVTKTWDAVSSIDFTGWGTCAATSSGIRINIQDAGPHTKGLGTQISGVPAGMVLNFTFQSWSPACQGQEEFCIRSIAVHEFGHALGFAHEQNRDDTPTASCKAEPQGGDGDFVIGSWDLASVMNYCNPEYNGNGNLSQTDIDAIRLVYDTGIDGLIVNENDDKCLDVSGGSYDNGAAAIAWPCHGGDNQRWDLVDRGDGMYTIVNRKSRKCLDVAALSLDNGAVVEQWDCNGGDNQAFRVESLGGVTRLIAAHSGKCLDLANFNQADGARIQQWDCTAGANQKWGLKK
jgi:hypothetical protein